MANQAQKLTGHVAEKLGSNEKALRRDITRGETMIWYNVRARRFQGARLRRQTPIGSNIVDFACPPARLDFEVDDDQHFGSDNIVRDARRDTYLAAQGCGVLHFNNLDVVTNKSEVLETIALALGDSEARTLPGKRGSDAGRGDLR